MDEAHIYKREKYLNMTKELEDAGYKAVVMPVEVVPEGSQKNESSKITVEKSRKQFWSSWRSGIVPGSAIHQKMRVLL